MQEESAMKDEKIKNLQQEMDKSNEIMLKYWCQIKEAQEVMESWKKKNQVLYDLMISENDKIREVVGQLRDVNKKYAASVENSSKLEKELETRKEKRRNRLKTVLHIILNAIAPAGDAETDAVVNVERITTPIQLLAPPTPLSPDTFSASFEEAERVAEEQPDATKILSKFRKLRSEYDAQRQRLVKVKEAQFETCELINFMIDLENKANDKITHLRAKIEKLKLKLCTKNSPTINDIPWWEEPRIPSRFEIGRALFRETAHPDLWLSNRQKKVSETSSEESTSSTSTPNSSPEVLQLKKVVRRRSKLKISDHKLLVQVQEALNRVQDQHDITGEHFALKLRQLPSNVINVTETLILDILYEAQLGNITRNTNLNMFDTHTVPPFNFM